MNPNVRRLMRRIWVEGLIWRFKIAKTFFAVPLEIKFESGLYKVTEGDLEVYVARRSRLPYMLTGIKSRLDTLKKEYLSSSEILRPGDFVIDCGANIGEFSIACESTGANVWAFEPDPTEFKALERNAIGRSINPMNCALWSEDRTMVLFDANHSGDSSLIDPGNHTRKIEIQAKSLDNLEGLTTERIRLIKLEAEGAEPEILEGMRATLERTDYVVVDMGPERGVANEPTVVPVTNLLYSSGFRLVRFSAVRCMGLYEAHDLKEGLAESAL